MTNNKPIIIRTAKIRDVDVLVQLQEEIANYHREIDPTMYLSGDQIKKSYKKHLAQVLKKRNYKILVMDNNSNVIGFIAGQIKKGTGKRIGYISDAYVKKDFRKQGLTKKALNDLLDWFKHQKVSRLELNVDSRNKIGVKTWEHLGFKEYAKRMKYEI